MAEKLITPEFRGSFVSLDQPRRLKGDPDSEPKYQMLIPIDPDDDFWEQLEDEIQAVAKEKFGKVPAKLKSPVKDGDTDGEEYDNLSGMKFINASNSRKPGVVDADLDPIIDPDELYSGAWYRASVNVWAWDHPTGGKGCSVSLNNVMKIRDDDRFDGSTSAEEDFAGFAGGGKKSKKDKKKKKDSLLD